MIRKPDPSLIKDIWHRKTLKLLLVIGIAMEGLKHANAIENILFYLSIFLLVVLFMNVKEYKISIIDILILILAAFGLVSSLLSPLKFKYKWFIKIAVEPLIIYSVTKSSFSKDDLSIVKVVFGTFFIVLIMITFLEAVGVLRLKFFEPTIPRLKNTEGAYLVALMPFFYTFAGAGLLALLCSIFSMTIIFLINSKAAFLASMLIMTLWITMLNKKKYLIALIIAVLSMAAIFPKNTKHYYYLMKKDPTNKRIYPWTISLRAIKKRPFLGWGVDKRVYGRIKYKFCWGREKNYLYIVHPHNDFLQVTLMVGLPGLILYLLIIGVSLKNLSCGFDSKIKDLRMSSYSIFMSILGTFIILSLCGIPALKFRRFFWFLIGLSEPIKEWCLENKRGT